MTVKPSDVRCVWQYGLGELVFELVLVPVEISKALQSQPRCCTSLSMIA